VIDSRIVSAEFPAVVFVNSISGGGKAHRYLPLIRRVFEDEKVLAEFICADSAAEMTERVRTALAEKRRLLIAVGGDGTFHEVANVAFGSDVVLGILPCGGGNDFAVGLQMPTDPVKAARAMLRGKIREVDLLRARTADGRERFYVGGGGLGLDARAMRYANGMFRHVPGRLRYVLSALAALRNFEALNVCAAFPGTEIPDVETRVLVAAALNTSSYGAGVRLAPDARPDDGLLNVVLVRELGLLNILRLLPRLLITGELQTSRITRLRAARVRFSADRPCEFQGDGEVIGPAPVEIEVVPRAIQVLAPIPE
jgi:diacylglycerol kinase (ATP)